LEYRMSEWQHPDLEIHGRLERWNAASYGDDDV